MDEPPDASGEVVPSLNTVGKRHEGSQSTSGSSSHSSSAKEIASSSKRASEHADVDSSSMKRRCALEGPSHFPPMKLPTKDGEKDEDASGDVENITDLTQRLSMSRP